MSSGSQLSWGHRRSFLTWDLGDSRRKLKPFPSHQAEGLLGGGARRMCVCSHKTQDIKAIVVFILFFVCFVFLIANRYDLFLFCNVKKKQKTNKPQNWGVAFSGLSS